MVVGAINVDLVVRVDRRPDAGETVFGGAFERRSGGKAANQAVAAARTGVEVGLVAAVGEDDDGAVQLQQLRQVGVDVGSVRACAGLATGFAMVTVTPDAENTIVVVPGANTRLTAAAVTDALVAPVAVVVGQTEVSAAAIDAAASACHAAGSRFVLNAAPVVPLLPETFSLADPLVVNQHEARQLCGRASGVLVEELARTVASMTGSRSVVVTLGAAGAAWYSKASAAMLPAAQTSAVDTTGAGDVFVGTLAAELSQGRELSPAVKAAISAATDAVTWFGARPHAEVATTGQPRPIK